MQTQYFKPELKRARRKWRGFFVARTYWRIVTSSSMADRMWRCHGWYPYTKWSIVHHSTLGKANGTGIANNAYKKYTILLKKFCYFEEDCSKMIDIWASSWDFGTLSHRRLAKAQASLRIRAVLPEPSLFAHMKYGNRRRVRPKIRHLAPLDGCACAFEEWVYGGRKVPKSHELAHFRIYIRFPHLPLVVFSKLLS